MADEKIITINLSKLAKTRTYWKRKQQTMKLLRKLLVKSVKSEDVKIDNKLNEVLWKGEHKKIRVKVSKKGEKTFIAELVS